MDGYDVPMVRTVTESSMTFEDLCGDGTRLAQPHGLQHTEP